MRVCFAVFLTGWLLYYGKIDVVKASRNCTAIVTVSCFYGPLCVPRPRVLLGHINCVPVFMVLNYKRHRCVIRILIVEV